MCNCSNSSSSNWWWFSRLAISISRIESLAGIYQTTTTTTQLMPIITAMVCNQWWAQKQQQTMSLGAQIYSRTLYSSTRVMVQLRIVEFHLIITLQPLLQPVLPLHHVLLPCLATTRILISTKETPRPMVTIRTKTMNQEMS